MGILQSILDPWGIASDVYHAVTGIPTAKEKRAQMNLINEQIKAYKDQTRIAKEETDRTRAEKEVQKRRIQEKQIRSLRRHFQPAGMSDEGMSDTLG